MQYAKMVDLIAQAKIAGGQRTEPVNQLLADCFDTWLEEQELGEITEEEYDRLKLAFEEGYGIYMHSSE